MRTTVDPSRGACDFPERYAILSRRPSTELEWNDTTLAECDLRWQAQSMSMSNTREDPFIKLFISAYERGSWADAKLLKPDAIDRTNPAVDQIATRESDGKTLAIEHTIVEPFVGEKQDFAFFKAAFLKIEEDKSLAVPGRWIRVFVPVGLLRQVKPAERVVIVDAVHSWIQANRLVLPDGSSEHRLSMAIKGQKACDVTLHVEVVPLAGPGDLHVRRLQAENDFEDVIESSLSRKVPKLVNTVADKRILLLERQHMNLTPRHILQEIERRRPSFPDLARVDEIWIVETIFYGTPFGGTYLRFELHHGNEIVGSFDFKGGTLIMKFEDGVAEVVRRVNEVPA